MHELRWVGVEKLAGETGIAVRTLQYIVAKEPGLLKTRNGKRGMEFEQPTCAVLLRDREVRKAGKNATPAAIEDSEKRLAEAQAQMAELKLAEMRKELMTVTEFRRQIDDANGRVSARLKGLPHKLAPAVVGVQETTEGLARVQPIVDEVMDELYRAEDVPANEDAT